MSRTDGQPLGGDRRRFYRVPARIPIRLRALDPVEAEAVALEIASAGDDPPEIADPGVAAAIQRIERKMDQILQHLQPDRAPPLAAEHLRWISISGGGVGLPMDAAVEANGPVLVEFSLPGSPGRHVRSVSHVVKSSSGGIQRGKGTPEEAEATDQFALSFDVIATADQEAIVRFSYEVQRVQLRERSVLTDSAL